MSSCDGKIIVFTCREDLARFKKALISLPKNVWMQWMNTNWIIPKNKLQNK